MQKVLSFIVMVAFFGCTDAISETDLAFLNGYWEIQKVTFPDGDTKEYTVNSTVDFIKLEGRKGFRKKVNPKFDGTFATSDDATFFEISKDDGRFSLSYKNDINQWKEKLLAVSEEHFEVSNEAGVHYSYKRFTPIEAPK